MARGKRGGYQRPARPAAASGPGALSQRTDGVPQMERTGLPYGENQAVNDQQSAAPLGTGQGSPAGGGGSTTSSPGMSRRFGGSGVFSPTQRPGEPMTAGVDWGAGPGRGDVLPDDPYMVARALYAMNPTPELERIVARLSRG